MTTVRIVVDTKSFFDFVKSIRAKDGYTVSFDHGQFEMEYEAGQLWMLCNDWTGYEVCQISQTKARKQRVHFILYDKDYSIA